MTSIGFSEDRRCLRDGNLYRSGRKCKRLSQ
jgi:hypothetical protein